MNTDPIVTTLVQSGAGAVAVKMTPDDIADVIDDGADYIAKFGWHKGALYGGYQSIEAEHPSACIMGGINYAMLAKYRATSVSVQPVYARLAPLTPEHSDTHNGRDCDSIACWNDHAAENEQQVLDWMRHAAKQVRIDQ
jgi:hypothetical protein